MKLLRFTVGFVLIPIGMFFYVLFCGYPSVLSVFALMFIALLLIS